MNTDATAQEAPIDIVRRNWQLRFGPLKRDVPVSTYEKHWLADKKFSSSCELFGVGEEHLSYYRLEAAEAYSVWKNKGETQEEKILELMIFLNQWLAFIEETSTIIQCVRNPNNSSDKRYYIQETTLKKLKDAFVPFVVPFEIERKKRRRGRPPSKPDNESEVNTIDSEFITYKEVVTKNLIDIWWNDRRRRTFSFIVFDPILYKKIYEDHDAVERPYENALNSFTGFRVSKSIAHTHFNGWIDTKQGKEENTWIHLEFVDQDHPLYGKEDFPLGTLVTNYSALPFNEEGFVSPYVKGVLHCKSPNYKDEHLPRLIALQKHIGYYHMKKIPDSFEQLLKSKNKDTTRYEIETTWDSLDRELKFRIWTSKIGEIYAVSDGWWLDFVYSIICNKNETYYRWLMDWCATFLQGCGQPMQTALFFGGKQGTGKNTFCNVLNAIVGEPYAICVSSIENILGHFNSLMDQTLLITLDEVYVPPKDAGILKNFITGDKTCLVKKFHDAKFIPRFYSVLLCSNLDNAIPAEDGDRRFTCFYLSSSARFRQKYFESLINNMHGDGKFLPSGDLADRPPAGPGCFLFASKLYNWKVTQGFTRCSRNLVTPYLRVQQMNYMKKRHPLRSTWFDMLREGKTIAEPHDWNEYEVIAFRYFILYDQFYGRETLGDDITDCAYYSAAKECRSFDSTRVVPIRPPALTDEIENNVVTIYKNQTWHRMVCLDHLRQIFIEKLSQSYRNISVSDILLELHNYYEDGSDIFSRLISEVHPYKSTSMKTATVEYVILPPLDKARKLFSTFMGWPNDIWDSLDFVKVVETEKNYESGVFSLFKQVNMSNE